MRLSLRSRPIPSKHCSTRASIEWFPATGRDWRSCCCSWSLEKSRRVQVQRHLTLRMVWRKEKAAGRSTWMRSERWGGPWRVQRTSALAYRRGGPLLASSHSEDVFLPLFFSRRLSVPRLLLHCLAASLRALSCFAEVNADGEMRRLIRFPCLYLFFVELKASMLCNAPVRCTALCWNEAEAISLFLFRGTTLVVWNGSGDCRVESSFRFRCVSSCRSKSVWKKSASVFAKDSALMVTVLTCSPKRSFFFQGWLPQHLGIFARLGALPLAVRVLQQQPPWPRKQHCPLSLMQIARRVFSASVFGR